MKVSPIETPYSGDLFRSRKEAKWAVFFKTLGLNYKYEIEGFNLDGVRYLPDFWLPDCKLWIEIKPEFPEVYPIKKAIRLSKGLTHSVLILYGSPWPGEYSGVFFDALSSLDVCENCGNLSSDPLDLVICPVCKKTMSYKEYPHEYEVHCYKDVVFREFPFPGEVFGKSSIVVLRSEEIVRIAKGVISAEVVRSYDSLGWVRFFPPPLFKLDSLNLAYIAARQARFEHRGNNANH